jgi:hypothetical protein
MQSYSTCEYISCLQETLKFDKKILARMRVLLENLTGSQLVKKFTEFYGTRRFIAAFISTRHLFLSWARSNQSISPHPTSWRYILIQVRQKNLTVFKSRYVGNRQVFLPHPVLSYLRLGICFPHISPPKTCMHFSSPPYVLHAPSISFFSIWSPEIYLVMSKDRWAPHYVVFSTPSTYNPFHIWTNWMA